MIKPTNGRVVLYTPPKSSDLPHSFGQTLAALIAHVHSDKMVNLMVIDANGHPHSITSVDLIQEGDTKPEWGNYCEWMPYQKGQAAKTEQAEKKLAAVYIPEHDKRFHALALANCHGEQRNIIELENADLVVTRAKEYLRFLEQSDEPQPDPQAPVKPIRLLTDHQVNNANEELMVSVLDQPGAGGACHHYHITGFDTETNPSDPFKARHGKSARHATILFQNGPINAEEGRRNVNGITHEVMLAILADRLRSFQAGPYHCEENAEALICVERAQLALKSRTLKRQQRGVEGTHTV